MHRMMVSRAAQLDLVVYTRGARVHLLDPRCGPAVTFVHKAPRV